MNSVNDYFSACAKTIIVRIVGGLGNQLFAYAAARRLALVNNAELVLDHVSGFTRDSYQRHYQLDHFAIPCRKATPLERLEPFPRLRRKILLKLNQKRPYEKRTYLHQEMIDFDPRLLSLRPKHNLTIEGYWQSENYFKDVESTIRTDLTIQPPMDVTNQAMADQIRSQKSVALHVRFFDAPNSTGGINNAPQEYYHRAIAQMEQYHPDAHYYLFSDKVTAARAIIPLPDERITVVSHNQGDAMAYADLWLMTLCQHFIIANSTFSWWGAWLGGGEHKTVIAPGFEKRDGEMWWGFDGLLPAKWIKL